VNAQQAVVVQENVARVRIVVIVRVHVHIIGSLEVLVIVQDVAQPWV